jgi:glutamate N-acetyltransferase/amino-acid N-acetyltransferase
MRAPEVEIRVDLGLGSGKARVWTCDLTKGYIEINGDYRS